VLHRSLEQDGTGGSSPVGPTSAPAHSGSRSASERQPLQARDFLESRGRLEQIAAALGIGRHFFEPVEPRHGSRVRVCGRDLISYSAYNYLGFNGDPRVSEAARDAIARYGTSVSASRLVAGERDLHRALERDLASLLGVEECLVFVSGHATNVTTLGCLLGPDDLVLHDVLCHNSIQQGIQLSQARALPFPHNNVAALRSLLATQSRRGRRVLIVTEGVFSMDGDLAPLPDLISLRQQYGAFLMVDEAHSLGVVGPNGRGIAEHFGADPTQVDLWMGTLSKTLASCGGYIAGCRTTVESLRWSAPGFVYSCGITPPNAAAALEALRLLRCEPERAAQLRENSRRFRAGVERAGLDVGLADATGVVPVVFGSSVMSLAVAHALFERGVFVHPIFYPAVPEHASRLRFFVTALHTAAEIDETVSHLCDAVPHARALLQRLPPEAIHPQYDLRNAPDD
jgi:8-amino-7-oxononanoate synthase